MKYSADMDKERLAELIGRIIATLEYLNKSDDELKDMIEEAKRRRRENFENVYKRLKDIDDRLAILEGKMKYVYLILSAMLFSVIGTIFALVFK